MHISKFIIHGANLATVLQRLPIVGHLWASAKKVGCHHEEKVEAI